MSRPPFCDEDRVWSDELITRTGGTSAGCHSSSTWKSSGSDSKS